VKSRSIGFVCGVLGLLILLWPQAGVTPPPTPEVPRDLPAKAFVTYEQLWRKLAADAATKLANGELKTEQQVWDFLAKGQEPARRIAFEDLAKSEQDLFNKNGGWTKEAHEQLLRSYAK
jgi:hypothetical protein